MLTSRETDTKTDSDCKVKNMNNMPGVGMLDAVAAKDIGATAQAYGLIIRYFNALQKIGQFDAALEAPAIAMVRRASAMPA